MSDQIDLLNLVKTYFNVCNAALVKAQGKPVPASIGWLLTTLMAPATLSVTVVDDQRKPVASFRSEFVDGQFKPIREGAVTDPDATFMVSRRSLVDVAERAEYFIEHPEKLEWDWLKQRLGAGE